MLSTELLMKLLRVWVIKKRCIKLMRMVMLLFLKLKRERKTRRKLKSLKDNLNKLKNKLLLNKLNQLVKVRTTKHLLKAKLNPKEHNPNLQNKVKPPLNKPKKNNKRMKLMISNSHYHHVHLRAELINLLTLFHTLPLISPEEDCLRNINLLLLQF